MNFILLFFISERGCQTIYFMVIYKCIFMIIKENDGSERKRFSYAAGRL